MIALAGPADVAVLTVTTVALLVPVCRWLRRPHPWTEQMAALRRANERSAR